MQLLIGWIIAGALIVILLWTNPSDIKAVLLQAGGHPVAAAIAVAVHRYVMRWHAGRDGDRAGPQ